MGGLVGFDILLKEIRDIFNYGFIVYVGFV